MGYRSRGIISPSAMSRLKSDLHGDFKTSVLVYVAKALKVMVDELLVEEQEVVKPKLSAAMRDPNSTRSKCNVLQLGCLEDYYCLSMI